MEFVDRTHIAALHIYSLSDADREWILNRLNDDEKAVLTTYISTLDTMSLPKDRKFINAAIEAIDEKSEKELYEILNRSVLVDIESVLDVFEREPSWIGACLKLEYPGLVESYIAPRLSKIKAHEINNYLNEYFGLFTNKFKSAVFDAVATRLKYLIPSLDDKSSEIEFDTAMQQAMRNNSNLRVNNG